MSRQRPSPSEPAKFFMGKDKLGNDGRMYTSTPDKNGVYRWRLKKHTGNVNIPAESILKKATKSELLSRLKSDEFRYFSDTHLYRNANFIIVQFEKDIYIVKILGEFIDYDDMDDDNLAEILSSRDLIVCKTKYLEKYTAPGFFKIKKDTYLYVDFNEDPPVIHAFVTQKQVKRLYLEMYGMMSFRSFIQLEGEKFAREITDVKKRGQFLANAGIDEYGKIYNIDPDDKYEILIFGRGKFR